MKDYLKANIPKTSLFDQKRTIGLTKRNGDDKTAVENSAEILNNSYNSSFRTGNRQFEVLDVYNGMSYDEWVGVRDKFLKTHNML